MKQILVVDDDRTARYLLSRTLRAAGFSVSTAQDGLSGLQQLRKKTYDLVLLDIWMPRMNGLELLAQMRLEDQHPKAVVMTSDQTPETLLRAEIGRAHV